MDIGTIVGIVMAGGTILLGLFLEGGQIGQILQPTAALIVFGGTLGKRCAWTSKNWTS